MKDTEGIQCIYLRESPVSSKNLRNLKRPHHSLSILGGGENSVVLLPLSLFLFLSAFFLDCLGHSFQLPNHVNAFPLVFGSTKTTHLIKEWYHFLFCSVQAPDAEIQAMKGFDLLLYCQYMNFVQMKCFWVNSLLKFHCVIVHTSVGTSVERGT